MITQVPIHHKSEINSLSATVHVSPRPMTGVSIAFFFYYFAKSEINTGQIHFGA